MDCMDLSLVFANTAQLDLQHCAYILCSDQFSSVDSGGYGWLFILAGVGGAGIYLASYSREDNSEDQEQLWRNRFTPLMWIFEDQERSEENSNPLFSLFLRGFHLGILSPNSTTVTKPAKYSDLSLNSLSDSQHLQKFLMQPICAKELLNTKSKDKKCNQNNVTKSKRSPFNQRMKQSKDEMILQRVVASNRLSFKFFKPGADLRMEGDGCENPEDFCETTSSTFDKEFLENKCSINCSNSHCTSPDCRQREMESKETKGWMDFLQNTEELRRFIRETSFDSSASDISFGINFNLEEEDEKDFTQSNLTDALFHPIDDYSYSNPLLKENTLWKLIDITDEADDDNRSCVGSVLDNWEWDEECYYAEDSIAKNDDNQPEMKIAQLSLLPDTCHELDLEAELCGSKSSTPSPTCGRASPLGRECIRDEYSEGEY